MLSDYMHVEPLVKSKQQFEMDYAIKIEPKERLKGQLYDVMIGTKDKRAYFNWLQTLQKCLMKEKQKRYE